MTPPSPHSRRFARLLRPCLLIAATAVLAARAATMQDPPAPDSPPDPPEDVQPPAAEPITAENNPLDDEINAALNSAVERGLHYLHQQQNDDGTFGRGAFADNVGVVSLCAMAFMADGNLPGRGRYGAEVEAALEYVLSQCSESGFIGAETVHGPMYGHGFATLFLGEIYGMSPDDRRVRDALSRAVDVILSSQNAEGGWRYRPVPNDADISVTICQVMALRSARNAGVKVPASVIERAVKYVRDCRNPDGGFRYMRSPGPSGWPRTAAGVASLYYAGIYEDETIDAGLDYITRSALPGAVLADPVHYFYGHYYAVQAMYLAGGARWEIWWPAVRDQFISVQAADGSYRSDYAGGAYATAMSMLVLQMPKRYLPIFQR
jgi:hypothetical protein